MKYAAEMHQFIPTFLVLVTTFSYSFLPNKVKTDLFNRCSSITSAHIVEEGSGHGMWDRFQNGG